MTKLFSSLSWKWYLGIFGLLIVIASVWYTNYLAGRLAKIEEAYTHVYARAVESANEIAEEGEECGCCDYSLQYMIASGNTTMPALIVDEFSGQVTDYANLTRENPDSAYLSKILTKWKTAGIEPIPSAYNTSIYLGPSRMLEQLRLFPFLQFGLIAAFVLFGYFALNAARRAEQNRVWVGLAKETAHQLGTPISAMIGWTEHLRLMYADQPDIVDVADELTKDVNRLEMVATRFSKIGSDPELEDVNIYEEIAKVGDYMAKRAPRKVHFNFPKATSGHLPVRVNPLLFDWVVENLLRNALDALEGKGSVSAEVHDEGNNVTIYVIDTGKGIPASKFNSVFKPGYTTKQRGWGLGLSLAKRIIEQYHKGRIFVKESEVGKGTTFSIVLPKRETE
ncbi:MAG: HAMP domain-containing sensor histidine kinase [Bacteroidota bacterium]